MAIKKLHVMVVVGTRPEIIRLSRVIIQLKNSSAIKLSLVHTGQNYNYNLNQVFFKELDLPEPNFFLESPGKTAVETIGNIFIKIENLIEKVKPDAFLVLGDTNSCLSAFVAKKKKIPIFHMEAGNRCFDQNVPEEINRRVVDHIADINLPYSTLSRNYLINEGIKQDRVIKTGSPMAEVLNYYKLKIENSTILEKLKLKSQAYFVVSSHREENVDNPERLSALIETLNEMDKLYRFPLIFSTHPRTRKQLEKLTVQPSSAIHFLDPLGFIDYVSLQKQSSAVLSDSGTISEEASILNFRALNIRTSHERPEAMEETSVMMVGLDKERILQGLQVVLEQDISKRNFNQVNDYLTLNVSKKIERILLSYTSYINDNVWKH